MDLTELGEGAEERLLDEVLRVPDGTGERLAISEEILPMRFHEFEKSHADVPNRPIHVAGQLDLAHCGPPVALGSLP
jgi:hypothetical protein